MLASASKDVSITFSDKCLHILNNKEILDGIKGSTKIKSKESLLKYQSLIYNVQSNFNVNHRGMKMISNNKNFHH